MVVRAQKIFFILVAIALVALLAGIVPPPRLNALVPGGALNAAYITPCTCGPGYLTYMRGVKGTPSGIYYFGPLTRYWVGSGMPLAWDLMFYTPNTGICMMYVGVKCKPFRYKGVNWYGGSS